MSLVGLFRQIIKNNPPVEVLNMSDFSGHKDIDENIGELVLEALLNTNIESITDLNFSLNNSWFRHPKTEEERFSNIVLLADLISKQHSL